MMFMNSGHWLGKMIDSKKLDYKIKIINQIM